ncbi:hypothetical protein C8N43_1326 [Litoreibacter ponti]|uniref:Uncharacterized protein n=1 Tax=Litoreibacter ponti TaxID=1510457 RepID=A0A2T6BKT8_9RHOB|nr:hypothetical protein C8N43_1326 [Litoreibacter ponti]
MQLDEPANLKFLRRLVTTLTATMIVGLVVLIALVVIRVNDAGPAPSLPGNITLPDGTTPMAVTYGPDWYLVVTDDDRILVFDQTTSELMQEHRIIRE